MWNSYKHYRLFWRWTALWGCGLANLFFFEFSVFCECKWRKLEHFFDWDASGCYPGCLWPRLKCSVNVILLVLCTSFGVFTALAIVTVEDVMTGSLYRHTNGIEHLNDLCVHYCQSSIFLRVKGFQLLLLFIFYHWCFWNLNYIFIHLFVFPPFSGSFLGESVQHSSWISFFVVIIIILMACFHTYTALLKFIFLNICVVLNLNSHEINPNFSNVTFQFNSTLFI